MKRKPFFPAAVVTTVLLLVAFSPVRGDSPRPGIAPDGRVTIDGKSFATGCPGQDDVSNVRREFERSGLEGPASGSPPALPRGLTAEHTLRLDSCPGSIDLVLGKLPVRGPSIRSRLAAEGWAVHGQAEATGLPWLLEKRNGKETTVVWLDEAEGTFLLFRETGR